MIRLAQEPGWWWLLRGKNKKKGGEGVHVAMSLEARSNKLGMCHRLYIWHAICLQRFYCGGFLCHLYLLHRPLPWGGRTTTTTWLVTIASSLPHHFSIFLPSGLEERPIFKDIVFLKAEVKCIFPSREWGVPTDFPL